MKLTQNRRLTSKKRAPWFTGVPGGSICQHLVFVKKKVTTEQRKKNVEKHVGEASPQETQFLKKRSDFSLRIVNGYQGN